MNRAWIPAAGLAGVSIAGLLALGRLTDSLGTNVSFPSSVPVTTPAPSPKPVPVSFSASVVGKTSTAAFGQRGGQAAGQAPTSGEAGQVSVRIQKTAPPLQAQPVTSTPSTSPTVAPTKTKPKRQDSIGGTSSGTINGDSGLAAGGTGSKSSHGGLKNKLGSDGSSSAP
jgi:hypothetical protein